MIGAAVRWAAQLWGAWSVRIITGGIVAALGLFVAMAVNLKIKTLERDLADCRRGIAESGLNDSEKSRLAETEAFNNVRMDDHERNIFDKETSLSIERARQGRNQPLDAVQRANAERLRARFYERGAAR